MWRIGIDEAGRGPVIGPLVVGALLIPETDEQLLKDAGITDSKLLSKEKREELDAWIRVTAEERGWKFVFYFFMFYLIRDSIIYILIPYLIGKPIFNW